MTCEVRGPEDRAAGGVNPGLSLRAGNQEPDAQGHTARHRVIPSFAVFLFASGLRGLDAVPCLIEVIVFLRASVPAPVSSGNSPQTHPEIAFCRLSRYQPLGVLPDEGFVASFSRAGTSVPSQLRSLTAFRCVRWEKLKETA